jgi:hypothetical protein
MQQFLKMFQEHSQLSLSRRGGPAVVAAQADVLIGIGEIGRPGSDRALGIERLTIVDGVTAPRRDAPSPNRD